MKKLKDDLLPMHASTHIRLFSGDVKNFDLIHGSFCPNSIESFYRFGFSMKRGVTPGVLMADDPDDENQCWVWLDKKGLESLINFLNRLCEEVDENP